MTWSHSIGIVRGLSIFVLSVTLLICALGHADKQRKANVLPDGSIDFTPNRRSFWTSPLVVAYLIYLLVNLLMHIHGNLLNIMVVVVLGLLLFMIAFSFPDTITVTDSGLEQVAWLWKHKRIRWADIVEINAGGGMVTITAADGTKIVHTRQLPDRPRLLTELKRQCGENLPSDFPDEATGKS
jgi:hypothetical protein